MLLDRIVGLLSAATVLLGAACEAAWLTDATGPQWRGDATTVFFAAAIASLVYVASYVAWRDHLPRNIEGDIEFTAILRVLPAWARFATVLLIVFGFGLIAIALVPAITSSCTSAASTCILWNPFVAGMIAVFAALTIADAVYLMRTKRG